MNTAKRIVLAILLTAMAFPLAAQEKSDTTYLFRFVAGKDMFFVPWSDNGRELDRLLAAVEENRAAIDAGNRYILVSSYGVRGSADQSAAMVAHIRRSRVKSELIVRGGVQEAHFVTDRSFAEPYGAEQQRNVVVVTLPAPVDKVAEIAGAEAAARVMAYNREISGDAARERLAAEQAARERAEQERLAAETAAAAKAKPYCFAVRTNLLRWATLTPDIGVEWRVSRSVGIVANASYTYWSWSDGDRRYSVLNLSPEVRWYLGRTKRGYVGAMFQTGNFNYKFDDTGKQGDHIGGGIVGGYQLPIGRRLMLDLGAGVGYVRADYEKYNRINGYNVRAGKETKDYFGINRVNIGLIWHFGGNGNK